MPLGKKMSVHLGSGNEENRMPTGESGYFWGINDRFFRFPEFSAYFIKFFFAYLSLLLWKNLRKFRTFTISTIFLQIRCVWKWRIEKHSKHRIIMANALCSQAREHLWFLSIAAYASKWAVIRLVHVWNWIYFVQMSLWIQKTLSNYRSAPYSFALLCTAIG